MKKIIYTILLIILNTGFVFAQNNLSINLDKEKIFLDESFSLNIKLITDQNIKNDLTIDGLEKFKKFGQQTQDQISIINGKQNMTTNLILSFYPTQTGSFTLGPAKIKIQDEIITSKTVTIKILDINKKIKQNEKENNENDDEKINNAKNSSTEGFSPLKNNGFNNIQGSRFSFYDLLYKLFFLFILILLIIYILIKFYKKRTKTVILNQNLEVKKEENKKTLVIKNLQKLQEQSNKLSKSEFYKLLNIIYKDYFEYLLNTKIQHFTYNEIKNLSLNTKLLEFFKKSYLFEFNNEKDDTTSRIELIENLSKYIEDNE